MVTRWHQDVHKAYVVITLTLDKYEIENTPYCFPSPSSSFLLSLSLSLSRARLNRPNGCFCPNNKICNDPNKELGLIRKVERCKSDTSRSVTLDQLLGIYCEIFLCKSNMKLVFCLLLCGCNTKNAVIDSFNCTPLSKTWLDLGHSLFRKK